MYANKSVIEEFTNVLERLNSKLNEADQWEVRILDAFARSNQDSSLVALGQYLIQAKNESVGHTLQRDPGFIRYMLKRYSSLKTVLESFKPSTVDLHPLFHKLIS